VGACNCSGPQLESPGFRLPVQAAQDRRPIAKNGGDSKMLRATFNSSFVLLSMA
jgi:hypothetical protein